MPDGDSAPPCSRNLDRFLARAVDELGYADNRLTVAGVKKLRTSLRRVRTVCEGMRLIDPDPAWNVLRVEARAVFRAFGPLRDLHVLREWIRALSSTDDDVGPAFLRLLSHRERKIRRALREQLDTFDGDRLVTLGANRVERLASFPPEEPVISQLALERWAEMMALHHRCQSRAPAVLWHDLRKGVKRFRYIVEAFRPSLHDELKPSIKPVQDALGELHDVDVLHDELEAILPLFPTESRRRWEKRLREERQQRLATYWELVGPDAERLEAWRASLGLDDEAGAAHERLRRYCRLVSPTEGHAADAAGPLLEALRPRPVLTGIEEVDVWLATAMAAVDLRKGRKRCASALRELDAPWPLLPAHLEELALMVGYAGRRPLKERDEVLTHLPRGTRRRIEVVAALLSAGRLLRGARVAGCRLQRRVLTVELDETERWSERGVRSIRDAESLFGRLQETFDVKLDLKVLDAPDVD